MTAQVCAECARGRQPARHLAGRYWNPLRDFGGQTAQAALYIAASVLLSLIAVAAGAALAQRGLA